MIASATSWTRCRVFCNLTLLLGVGLPSSLLSASSLPPDDPLAAAATQIASRLRANQQPFGGWLTAFTPSVDFQSPNFERNTFVTAVMVDVLAPVGQWGELGSSLSRARIHIASQVEADGLVRYYGKPDVPPPPSWGSLIVPDADDTALAWSSGADLPPALRPGAIAVLKRYRTPSGLYLTWLDHAKVLVGVNPGKDPNPADVGIQMNVLTFLAQADPPAAKELHRALRQAIADDDVWVYYTLTPLLPTLRAAELRKAGYDLALPPSRKRAVQARQRDWVSACELLARCIDGEIPPAAEVRAVLESLWGGGGSYLQRHPPLLYHNDLSASISRYYWSEDVGYALWLRLYAEASGASPISPSPR